MTIDPLDPFGPFVTGNDVEQAVKQTLVYWLPTYLAKMERRTGRQPGSLPLVKTWHTVGASFEQPYEAVQMPAAIIVSPGTVGEPVADGDGLVSVPFGCSVAIVVQGSSRENANEVAKLYAAAVRLIALHKGALGVLDGDTWTPGFAHHTEWVGEGNGELPSDFMPSGWATETELHVHIDGVATSYGGPATPDLDPGDLGTVQTVEVTVEPEDTP